MKKYQNILTILIFALFTASVRILYYLFDYTGVLDTFGYYDVSMIKLEEGERLLSSTLGFTYTNALSRLLSFVGNHIEIVFIWQVIMEVTAIMILFISIMKFYGLMSAFVGAGLLSVSPMLVDMTKIVSPEEYYLFFFSIGILILSLFYSYSRNHHFTRCLKNEMVVLGIGIYMGVLITWNYLGFIALIIFLMAVMKNYRLFIDKTWLQEMTQKDIEEQYRIMPVKLQCLIAFCGIVLGMFFTLLKHTGYTGYGIADQFIWWVGLYRKFPYRTMDFDTVTAGFLIASFLLAFFVNKLIYLKDKDRENKRIAQMEKMRPLMLEQEKAFVNKKRFGYRKEQIGMKFDLEEISIENKNVRIQNNDLNVPDYNAAMIAAAEGIEELVKFAYSGASKEREFDFETGIDDDFDH